MDSERIEFGDGRALTIEGDWGESQTTVISRIFEAFLESYGYHDMEKQEDDTEGPHWLYDRVLTALAVHYGCEWPNRKGFDLKAVLTTMIEDCSKRGYSRLSKSLDEALSDHD